MFSEDLKVNRRPTRIRQSRLHMPSTESLPFPVIFDILVHFRKQIVNFLRIKLGLAERISYRVLFDGLMEEVDHFQDRVEGLGLQIHQDLFGFDDELLSVFGGGLCDQLLRHPPELGLQLRWDFPWLGDQRVESEDQVLIVLDNVCRLLKV